MTAAAPSVPSSTSSSSPFPSSTSPSTAAQRLRQHGYDPDTLLTDFHRNGYVIVDGVLSPSPDSPLSLDSLRACAEDAIQLTRSSAWKARRVVGNAFPPFDSDNRDSWGVQHIMNPQLDVTLRHARTGAATSAALSTLSTSTKGSLSPTFQEFYSSSPLLDVASLLIGAPEERLQMELFNLLINPEAHSYFALAWHRDDIWPEFNTALYDDDCLFLVPGSHRRLRTEEEKSANLEKAPLALPIDDGDKGTVTEAVERFDGSWNIEPPQTLRMKLKAGQTAFYSQRILNQASYLCTRKRATLHACYGNIGDDAVGEACGAERARNVLQHGVEWMRDEAFGRDLPERLRPMWSNLIRTEQEWASKDLGYSLDN